MAAMNPRPVDIDEVPKIPGTNPRLVADIKGHGYIMIKERPCRIERIAKTLGSKGGWYKVEKWQAFYNHLAII